MVEGNEEKERKKEVKPIIEGRKELTDKQRSEVVIRIIDKIMISQIIYLAVPTLLLFLFFNFKLLNMTAIIMFLLPILGGIVGISIVVLLLTYKNDYNQDSWFNSYSFYSFLALWTSNLLFIGVPLDRSVFGFEISGFLTLTFLTSFLFGYPLSRSVLTILEKGKDNEGQKNLIYIVTVGILIGSIALGILLIIQSLFGLKIPWFGNSPPVTFALGIYMIVFGSLVAGIVSVNVKLYDKLGKPGGINIWNRTDNHNIFICLRNLIIAVFVLWVFIIIILLMIFGGGDGGDLDLDVPIIGSSGKKKKKTSIED
jgi:hypothetical protein